MSDEPSSPTWFDLLGWLVENAGLSADMVAIGHVGTEAERTRKILRRGLEALLSNRLIKIAPFDEWPQNYVIDPPYDKFFGSE